MEIIGKQPAYLVPGVPSFDDLKLCSRMNLCLYSGMPTDNLKYSKKSFAKQLFLECDIPVPPASNDVQSET